MQRLEHKTDTDTAKVSRHETEIYAFLESLRQVKFYGELTLYFQAGAIEHCRTISRIAKKDIVKAYRKPLTPVKTSGTRKKIIVKVKPSPVPKAAPPSKQDNQLLLFALTDIPAAVIPIGDVP